MPNFSQISHSLATQMLDAVTYLHERGIAHCDIAPSNFVLARSGRVVLFDFGISVEQGDEKAGEMHLEIGAECDSFLAFARIKSDPSQAVPYSRAPLTLQGLRFLRSRPLGTRCHPRRVLHALHPR